MTIAEDASSPAAIHTSTKTGTTASFTPPAGALIVVMVACDGNANQTTSLAVTDSGSHTWTTLKLQNTSTALVGGACGVFCLDSPNASMTVTATWSGTGSANGGNIVTKVLTGAAAAASQTGATGGVSASSNIAPTVSITTTTANSHVYGAALDYSTNATLTANAQTTSIDQFLDSTNGDTWATWKGSADTGTPGATTFGFTNANAVYMLAGAEILASAGGSTVNGTASIAGAGAVTATATQGVTALPAGAGSLSAPATQAATAAPAGAGALSVAAVQSVTAAPVGAGSLAAAVTQRATASPAGAGTVSSAAVQSVTAALTGAGALAATVTQLATVAASGAGTLTASSGSNVFGTASLTAAGTLAATVTQGSTASPVGAAALTAKATQAATGILVAAGAMAAAVTQAATAAMAGAGALSASGGGGTDPVGTLTLSTTSGQLVNASATGRLALSTSGGDA